VITFKRSADFELIRSIMIDPRLFDAAADDFTGSSENWEPRRDTGIWYVLAFDGDRLLGLFALAPQSNICWEIHTRLLPVAWGAIAAAAAAAVVPWIWANTPCVRLVTICPSYNRLAIRFAEKAGMVRYGLNPQSWLKNSRLHDQVLLGLSKD